MDSPVSRNVADKSTQPVLSQSILTSNPASILGQPGPCEKIVTKGNNKNTQMKSK